MKLKNKLYCRYKDNDIQCYYPAGTLTNTDANFVLSDILDKKKCAELKNRGYDLQTLKFEISPLAGNIRFVSERKPFK